MNTVLDDTEWKKNRRDSFIEFMAKENELFGSTTKDIVWMSALVDLLIEDLCTKYSGKELEDILNDDVKMLDKYIAFLETHLDIGNFRPLH